ncbi:hypothetical protein BH23ACT9_BH23ACT9_11690 [soil metagenome]
MTPEHAERLPFTSAVLDETMRLYPPAYGTGRIAQRDAVVDVPALKRERFTYVPFGAGPRSCIGSYFAVLEAQIALAALLQRISFASRFREVGFDAEITLSPNTPMPSMVAAR